MRFGSVFFSSVTRISATSAAVLAMSASCICFLFGPATSLILTSPAPSPNVEAPPTRDTPNCAACRDLCSRNFLELRTLHGVRGLHAPGERLWYALPDLIVAKLSGKTPRVLRAIRFQPSARIGTLIEIALRGVARVRSGDDMARLTIELRKTIANDPTFSDDERSASTISSRFSRTAVSTVSSRR